METSKYTASNGRDENPGTDEDERILGVLKDRVIKQLEKGGEITIEKAEEAIDSVVGAAHAATEFTVVQISRTTAKLREEIVEHVAESGNAARKKLTPRPRTRFLFLGSVAMGIGSFLLGRFSTTTGKSDVVLKGETVAAGLFSCTNCGTRLQLESTSKLPACSTCKNEKFARVN